MINDVVTALLAQLTKVDFLLVEELAFLTSIRRRKVPGRVPWVAPSRKYLGNKIGCRGETISRHTTTLERLGVLKRIHRRQHNGQWQSVVYVLRNVAYRSPLQAVRVLMARYLARGTRKCEESVLEVGRKPADGAAGPQSGAGPSSGRAGRDPDKDRERAGELAGLRECLTGAHK